MEPAVINRRTLFWTGEHWINFLRRPGEEAHSGMVSLYHTHYSAAGAGIVALVHVDAPQPFTAICTDNRALVPFIQKHWPRGRIPPFDNPDVPILDATFRRGGDIRHDPCWIISVAEHEIVARWTVTQPPLVMTRAGAGPGRGPGHALGVILHRRGRDHVRRAAGGRTTLHVAALGAAAGYGA